MVEMSCRDESGLVKKVKTSAMGAPHRVTRWFPRVPAIAQPLSLGVLHTFAPGAGGVVPARRAGELSAPPEMLLVPQTVIEPPRPVSSRRARRDAESRNQPN